MSFVNNDNRRFIVPNIDNNKSKIPWNKHNFDNQIKILKKQKEEPYKNKYNAYSEYQKARNLSVDPQPKNLNYYYIHIDSSEREKQPKIESENTIVLGKNPLVISNNNNEIFIRNYNTTFLKGDKFTLTGLSSDRKILSTIYKNRVVIDSNVNFENNYLFEFTNDSYYIKINYKHSLSPKYLDPDTINVNVEIEGFRGNDLQNQLYYENIPIDIINKKHKLFLTKRKDNLNDADILDQYNSNYFFIELSEKYTGPTKNIDSKYNLKIQFFYYGGIPLNYLNANYPITVNNVNGFHIVTKSEEHGFYFKPLVEPSFVMEENFTMNSIDDIINFNTINIINQIEVGGENIKISKINKLLGGYVNPNKYTISLKETFTNVYSIRMVGCLFPRTNYIIKNISSNEQNNKIYWSNYNDSLQDGTLYQTEIPQGDYDINNLVNILQESMNKVKRNLPINLSKYDNSHNFNINCFESSNTVTFESLKKAKLKKPFIDIDPDPNINKDGKYIINIKLEDHKLTKDLINMFSSDSIPNTVIIEGSLDYNGINSSLINTEHQIHEIIDKDTFSIQLDNVNLNDLIVDNKGGNNITIYVKDLFRLHFNKSDTLGSVLGFRNIGSETSITYYNYLITNNDLYDSESAVDEFGNDKIIESNKFQLVTDNYLIMTLQNSNLIYNTGKIKKFFNQIFISSDGYYDTCLTQLIPLESPLSKLSEINVAFYTKEGNLYNFKNLDHSYLLEISTIKNKPENTTKDIKTGIIT
jgi:hypothetical protein